MLESSFVHLPGIGSETEKKLWSQGLHTWDLLEVHLPNVFGARRVEQLTVALEESRLAIGRGEYHYFHQRLKSAEMWRVLPALLASEFGDRIAYLDIETTGLGFPPRCHSTTVAVLYRGQLHLEHDSARKRALLREVADDAKLLVTFNGGTFDLPFLRREFDLRLDQAHLDLRYWLARLDFRGGLKRIQKCFTEIPQRQSMDIDGFDAVRLWRMYEGGDKRALETLMTYNAEDTVVLEQLVHCALNIEAKARPQLKLQTYMLPQSPKIPTQICPKVYGRLRTTDRY